MKISINWSILMKVIKTIAKLIGGLLALIAIYLLVAFILSRKAVNTDLASTPRVEVHILTNGIHTDIVVPTVTDQINWFTELPHLKSRLDPSDYPYLAIGWGDKGFYLNTPSWSELKVSTAVKAIFGLSGTAVHATYYRNMKTGERCKKMMVSKAQYSTLIEFIKASLDKNEQGDPIQIETKVRHGDTDAFYEATGRYSPLNTCNSWANRGLKVSGQKACLWTTFQEGIFLKYP